MRRSDRIPGLDGLRALACLLVFGVHFGQLSHAAGQAGPFDLTRWLSNGNTGVALFFALSGYVLSLPYGRAMEAAAPWPATLAFWRRRVARILPAYYACLFGLVLLNHHLLKAGGPRDVLLHLLLIFNLDPETTLSINAPFWTLAVEVQFYALLPLAMAALRHAGPRTAGAALLLLAGLVYVAFAVASGQRAQPPSAAWTYSLFAHAPHFLLGCVAAMWCGALAANPSTSGPRWNAIVLLSLVLLVVMLATPLDELLQIPHGRYNLPYAPLLCVALIVAVPRSALGRALFDNAVMRALGTISYGVYLYHLPLQHVTARLMPRVGLQATTHALAFGAISLLLTIAVAAVSYRLLETPLRRALRGR